MTITLHWWYLPTALFLFPIAYGAFKNSMNQAQALDHFITTVGCWVFAVGILLGHFIF